MKKFLSLMLILFALVGCGKSEEEKEKEKTDKKVDNGEARITKMNEIAKTLYNKYNVNITYYNQNAVVAQSTDVSALTSTECHDVKSLLTEFVNNGNAVLEIAKDDNIVVTNESTIREYTNNATQLNVNIVCQ